MNRIPSFGRWCLFASLVAGVFAVGDVTLFSARNSGRTRSSQGRATFAYAVQHGASSAKRAWKQPPPQSEQQRQVQRTGDDGGPLVAILSCPARLLPADFIPPGAWVFVEGFCARVSTLHALGVRLNL